MAQKDPKWSKTTLNGTETARIGPTIAQNNHIKAQIGHKWPRNNLNMAPNGLKQLNFSTVQNSPKTA
jgi:hypothetical protein